MTATTERGAPDTGGVPTTRHGRHLTAIGLGAWVALVVVGRVWGLRVVRDAPEPLYVDAVPFYGVWKLRVSPALIIAAIVAAACVAVLPWAARRLGWVALCAAVMISAVGLSLALGAVEPPPDTWQNIHGDYGRYVPFVEEQGLGGFLRDYTERQQHYPTHLSAHPPGMTVLLWAEDRLGLGGTAGEVGLAMLGVAAAAAAVLVALREVAGEARARAAAAFVVVAPAAVWHTNADVVFGGIALSGLALVVLATGRAGRSSKGWALAGGALLGAAMLFSHGLALMAVAVVPVVVARRRWGVAAWAGAGALAALALPFAWGYSWLAGLLATKDVYDDNLARVRPYGYFVVGNLVAFAVAVGPATAVALARLRHRGTWLLVGGGLAAVALADLSGLSLAETERIWQPFMPLVLVAGGVLALESGRRGRGWLALQAATTIALVAFLRSPW